MIGFRELENGFKELGLENGDVALVHSSFKSFGGVEGGPQTVIDALLEVLGEEGTLVVPTFNFSFCELYNKEGKGYFDVDNTPSKMGILTELVRKMPGAKRSVNPIYSVAVYGKFSDKLSSVNDKNVFGKGSIFGKLHELNAKIMIIGLSYNNSWTFVHYIEQMEGCNYRYLKDFSGTIVVSGKKYEDTFSMLVRDLDKKVITNVDPMGEILEKRGAVKIKKIGQSIVKLMKAKEVYDITAAEMKKNPRLLYAIGGEQMTMMKLINDLWFKRRDIVSDGYDESLDYISKIIPLKIHTIPSGTKCWTWIVPEKWSVKEAYVKEAYVKEVGGEILNLKKHPLHVMSYSLPIDEVVTKEELMEHLHTNPKRPGAIPFEFKYYERDWGFCIQHNRLKEFTKGKYKVFIDSNFEDGTLKVGDYTIKGETNETIVLVAHLCHPAMANDDLTGVAVLVDIAKELNKRSNRYTYKFLLVPETIGSVAYLSQNEAIIPKLKYGIFLEMLGNNNIPALQLTRQGNTRLDRIARHVMTRKLTNFREGPFRKIVGNDEMVFNGPGVNVPMISISRSPYPEYHTSDDNPGIISEENVIESKNLILEIMNILDSDYVPKRKFKGPVFLSGYGLWVDWRTNKKLNENIEQIMLRLEGDKSIFDIAEELDMEFDDVLNYVNKFLEKGLIVKDNARFL